MSAASRHAYDFRSAWRVDSPPEHVFAVLQDVRSYPAWWPEVRRVERIDDATVLVTIRSALPYTLSFELRRDLEDEPRRLTATMAGDLVGWSSWELVPDGDETELRFRERARVARPALAAVEPLARPAFIANHAWMMWNCRRGLEAALAGYATGARSAAR
ncbi:MAG TPA: SRPBCC family protein [Actinomycetota bacterium]|nr:SRPBCC family protein [Actinomycetota bacterium]